MPAQKRFPTDYPGVSFIEGKAVTTGKPERIYVIRYRKDGRLIEEKAGRQFQDAMTPAKAARIRSERIEGKALSNQERREAVQAAKEAEVNRWTIARLWEEYKAGKSNFKGLTTDENRFKNFVQPAFGSKEPGEIIPLDVDRLRVKLLKTHSAGTVKNVLELLRRVINFGVKRRLCPPTGFVIEMPKGMSMKTEDLDPEELAALLEAIEKDDHPHAGPMMKLALFNGMRKSEMLKLKWQDIDFNRGFINLPDAKSGQDEKIPLSVPAKGILEGLAHDGEYVFPGRSGARRVYIQRYVNRIRDRAGLPKGFRALHGLRHVYASMLASSGQVDMYTLQKLLTHKSPQMT
ncbi:MAG: site-specific integrase, partial [Desulfovibrionaceae bacterium]|nr:site-specific integrase [Desulfovibrionaceae bacterium]